MLASGRAWSSEEIARTTLKLVSDAARADNLVEAILGDDPRFLRRGAFWSALSRRRPKLRQLTFLLAHVPPAPAKDVSPPLFLRRYDPTGRAASEIGQVAPDGAGLDPVAGWFEGNLVVSLSAPAARRALHRIEQRYAVPATSDRLLDLAALLRHLGRGPAPETGRRGAARPESEARAESEQADDGPEAGLDACRLALDQVLDLRGDGSLEEIEQELERSRRAEPVDFSQYRFGREVISLLPARPGIYRFRDAEGRLLYVGKSRDLGRRVASYFRPLGAGHERRARLLAELRDLDWETVPSELEALILEGEAIRRERPPFNQQIDLHDAGERTTVREADLAFVLCEGDPEEVSVFFVRDGKPFGRARLPRSAGERIEKDAGALASAWFEGATETPSALVPIGEEEGLLVLRYLRHHRDRIDHLCAADLSGVREAAEGLIRLAVRDRPAWDPWTLRSPSGDEGSIAAS
jgi:hypothetical protein